MKTVFQGLLSLVDKLFPAEEAFAHCDIPCGIYSGNPAQMAADTVVKMVEKILALPTDGSAEEILQARNSFVRMVMIKEQHAEFCKKELLILWTDYFKPEHLMKYPGLHEKIWQTAKLCSKNKQGINMTAAKDLQEAVHEIVHIFEESKK